MSSLFGSSKQTKIEKTTTPEVAKTETEEEKARRQQQQARARRIGRGRDLLAKAGSEDDEQFKRKTLG